MSSWIFPCNTNLYDPFRAFAELHELDWRQSVRLDVGDEVFIYCSKPYQKLMFRNVVKKAEIPPSKVEDSDLKFSKSGEEIGNEPRFGYVRLSLTCTGDFKELALDEIVKHGIKKAPQGQMRMSKELYDYVVKYLR